MDFAPRSLEDLAADRLWPEGVYPFDVISAEQKTSKSGNPMIALEICIYNDAGKERHLKDWLLEKNLEKLAQFCRFTGMEDLYNEGKVEAHDFENREGFVHIRIEKPKPKGHKDYDEKAREKNVVGWYCPKPADRADQKDMESRRNELKRGFDEAERLKNPGTGLTDDNGDDLDPIPF